MNIDWRRHIVPVGFLLALQVLVTIAVEPWGEIALMDDWSYLLALRWLTEDNRLAFTNWQSTTLIGQLGWSWAFTEVFGFSIAMARMTTTFAATTVIVGVYVLALELLAHRWLAVLAAACVSTNVLFVLVQYCPNVTRIVATG